MQDGLVVVHSHLVWGKRTNPPRSLSSNCSINSVQHLSQTFYLRKTRSILCFLHKIDQIIIHQKIIFSTNCFKNSMNFCFICSQSLHTTPKYLYTDMQMSALPHCMTGRHSCAGMQSADNLFMTCTSQEKSANT